MDTSITVYMPTKDRAPLAARAIQSVLNQTYPAFELIVVDDGSAAEDFERLAGWFKDESRLRLVRRTESAGAGAARNCAIDLARGEYITGLDDDDTFASERLQLLVDAWHTHNSDGRYSALFTRMRYGDRAARLVQTVGYDDLFRGNYIGNQVFTLTSRLSEIGGFDEQMPALQDYETWMRLTRAFGPALGLPEATYVVDLEYPRERISGKSRQVLQQAFERIVGTHGLDSRRARRLKCVLFSYPQVSMSVLDLLEQWSLGNYGQASRIYLAKKLGLQA